MAKNTSQDNRAFLKLATTLAMPIMIQNLISTLVNSADTIMLGYVSQTAMSASSLANGYTFVLFCFYFGLSAGTSVLCAQYFGKGDSGAIERIVGLATRMVVIISAASFAVSFLFPRQIMTLFTNSPETIEIGVQYLKVISFSFVFMGFSQIYVSALRSMGKVVFPSITYVVSLLVNVSLNASFIFGLFGLPKLGVVGVALGTVIARIVETLMCLAYSFIVGTVRVRVKYIFAKAGVLLGDFLRIAAPSVGNDAIWSLAMSAFTAILGHIGDDMVAANAVTMMVVNIGAIASRGFANATTIVISQNLGANDMEAAKLNSKRMLFITFAVSLVGCAIMMLIRPFMISFYADKLTETALKYLGTIMLMATWRFVGEGINTCLICGCFRGGGDSRFGFILDTFYMWLVAVPAMASAAFLFKLPPLWVYFVMSMDEFTKMPIVVGHYLKFKWMKNITRDAKELE